MCNIRVDNDILDDIRNNIRKKEGCKYLRVHDSYVICNLLGKVIKIN